jgi:hypothetical protein
MHYDERLTSFVEESASHPIVPNFNSIDGHGTFLLSVSCEKPEDYEFIFDCSLSVLFIMGLCILLRVLSRIGSKTILRNEYSYGGRYRCADTSPTLTDCLWFLHWLFVGTQRTMNCTRRMLLFNWRVASFLDLAHWMEPATLSV